MSTYQITGFQSDSAPHWSVAIIEEESELLAREELLAILIDPTKRPDEVWGWDDFDRASLHQDPEKWRVDELTTPVRFVLGGGCR